MTLGLYSIYLLVRYNTGDFFSMDKDGNFYFKSRRKERITARGSGKFRVNLNSNIFCLSISIFRPIGYLPGRD